MKIITLARGQECFVDDEDFEELNKHRWYIQTGYAARRDSERREVFMHNVIMKVSGGVDHKDRVKLNNQRSNLRVASASQNTQNRVNSRNTSGFSGVAFNTTNNAWQAQIMCNYKLHYLGRFVTSEDAAHAYDLKAIELFGREAHINFPNERESIVRFLEEKFAYALL